MKTRTIFAMLSILFHVSPALAQETVSMRFSCIHQTVDASQTMTYKFLNSTMPITRCGATNEYHPGTACGGSFQYSLDNYHLQVFGSVQKLDATTWALRSFTYGLTLGNSKKFDEVTIAKTASSQIHRVQARVGETISLSSISYDTTSAGTATMYAVCYFYF
jgi:hypothetical protein